MNRWGYVERNPINYTDPSGHIPSQPCNAVYCNQSFGNNTVTESVTFAVGNISSLLLIAKYDNCASDDSHTQLGVDTLLLKYGVELALGTGGYPGGWTTERKQAVLDAVSAVGSAFAKVFGGKAEYAFQLVYKTYVNPLVFVWGNKLEGMPYDAEHEEIGTGCLTKGTVNVKGRKIQVIKCVSLSGGNSNNIDRMRNNIVHELGHLFEIATEGYIAKAQRPYKKLSLQMQNNIDFQRGRDPNLFYGFADAGWETNWQQHGCTDGDAPGWYCQDQSEIFADQFLGWTFNKWESGDGLNGWSPSGEARAAWMKANMQFWLDEIRPGHQRGR